MKFTLRILPFLLLLLLAGCTNATTTTAAAPRATPSATHTATLPTATVARPPVTPLPQNEAFPPIALQIPAIKLDVAVVPMTWQVALVNGERRAEWQLPLEDAGWHVNSGKVGTDQAVVISGHHRVGAHVFAPIAQGGVQIGQEIWLTDTQARVWIYSVSKISQPIPVSGASKAEQAELQSYLAPLHRPQLILFTGWPEFSDTHYLVVTADLTGRR